MIPFVCYNGDFLQIKELPKLHPFLNLLTQMFNLFSSSIIYRKKKKEVSSKWWTYKRQQLYSQLHISKLNNWYLIQERSQDLEKVPI